MTPGWSTYGHAQTSPGNSFTEGGSELARDRHAPSKKFGNRAERKARYAAKKLKRAKKKLKRETRASRRINAGQPTARERSAGARVRQMMLATIKAAVKTSPVLAIAANTSLGGYTPFKAAQPGKLNLPWSFGKKKIIDIGGGARGGGVRGGNPATPGAGLGGGTTPQATRPLATINEMRVLGGRYARTAAGRRAIRGAKVTAAIAGGAIAGAVADDIIEDVWQMAMSKMGGGVKPSNTQFNPKMTNAGVGVYFRNKLISLLTEEQYDQFWRNAATHIRKHLKAL